MSEARPGSPTTDLAALLRDGGLGAEALDILSSVAAALDDMHDRGLIHQQLSPGSVLIDVDRRAYLAAPTERAVVRATGTAGHADVAVYRAPEQAGTSLASHRTDLYAFTCVAFEAITGTPPFTVASVPDQVAGVVPRADARATGLPTAVDEVFQDALGRVPEDRPPSAAAVVDALIAAFGDRYRPRAGRGLRRVVWITGAAAAVAVVTAALLAVLTVVDGGPSAADRPPPVSVAE